MAKRKTYLVALEYIAEFIALNGLIMEEFSKYCNVDLASLKKIFTFKKDFPFEDLCKISLFIKVPISKLVVDMETEIVNFDTGFID